MPSIEEAFEPFGSLNRRMGKANAQAAARTLALAGFELGGLRTCNSSACGSGQPDGSTWRCRYCGPRTKIEALGKEAE